MAISGILWDLDGVLVDTGDMHYAAWSHVFAERTIPFSREFFTRTFGMNNAGLLELLLGRKVSPMLVEEISNQKEELFRQRLPGNATLLPGATDCLDQMKKWGLPQAVASSAPLANIEMLVDALGIRDYFTAIVSGEKLAGKPDPAVFLAAAKAIGVEPASCLVIEDSIPGVEAAKRAGMFCIAVLTTNPAEALTQADIIVDNLDDLSTETMQEIIIQS